MKLVSYLLSLVIVGLAATWAYQVNYTTRNAVALSQSLRQDIMREKETIAILEAEWVYLNRPDRLARLVVDYQDELRLVPLAPEQFGDAAMVAYPSQSPLLLDTTAEGAP